MKFIPIDQQQTIGPNGELILCHEAQILYLISAHLLQDHTPISSTYSLCCLQTLLKELPHQSCPKTKLLKMNHLPDRNSC